MTAPHTLHVCRSGVDQNASMTGFSWVPRSVMTPFELVQHVPAGLAVPGDRLLLVLGPLALDDHAQGAGRAAR